MDQGDLPLSQSFVPSIHMATYNSLELQGSDTLSRSIGHRVSLGAHTYMQTIQGNKKQTNKKIIEKNHMKLKENYGGG